MVMTLLKPTRLQLSSLRGYKSLQGGVWGCWALAQQEGQSSVICPGVWGLLVLLGNRVGRGHRYWVWVGTSKKPTSNYFFTFGACCLILSQLSLDGCAGHLAQLALA